MVRAAESPPPPPFGGFPPEALTFLRELAERQDRAWMAENKNGRKNFLKMRKAGENHPVEKVGTRLRAMMSWMKK